MLGSSVGVQRNGERTDHLHLSERAHVDGGEDGEGVIEAALAHEAYRILETARDPQAPPGLALESAVDSHGVHYLARVGQDTAMLRSQNRAETLSGEALLDNFFAWIVGLPHRFRASWARPAALWPDCLPPMLGDGGRERWGSVGPDAEWGPVSIASEMDPFDGAGLAPMFAGPIERPTTASSSSFLLARTRRWSNEAPCASPLDDLRNMQLDTLYRVRRVALNEATARALLSTVQVFQHTRALDDAIVGTEGAFTIRGAPVSSFVIRDLPDGIVLGLDEHGREIARLEGAVQG